ncbi:MAG TPA: class I adenylate-forming enzyme family protein [Nevskiaceae bacterium]|nr:class I adenylate-forming enzyme family protein [Nevskiaceae bacterium]
MTAAPFEWGRDVVESTLDGHPLRVYAPRRTHLVQFLEDARPWADREYLVQGERRLTFAQHERCVDRVADLLVRHGVAPGDRVMLLAANSIEWVVAYWAILKARAVVVSANAWWSEHEVAGAIAIAQPRLVIADARRTARLPPGTACLDVGDVRAAAEDEKSQAPSLPVPPHDEHDAAVVLFTSGTTGAPKGAVLSHRSQIAHQHNQFVRLGVLPHQLDASAPAAKTLASSPLFHVAGLMVIMGSLLAGGCIVMTEGRYEARQIFDLVARERITRWGAVPTMAVRLLDDPGLATADLSSLTQVMLGGSRIPPGLPARVREAIPSVESGIAVIYGLSEAGGLLASISGPDLKAHPGSVGKPYPVVEIRIDRPDADGCGEILARSPTNMSGYLGRPDDRTLDAEGFLHTGDLGRLDADGYLYITGRGKEVIIRGGENVSAPHVENCLLQVPGVREVAVLGLEHADWGEEVGAAVVVHAGAAVHADDLRAHCARRLAHFEVPTRWWIRTAPLPTNDSGKIVKPRVAAEWPA